MVVSILRIIVYCILGIQVSVKERESVKITDVLIKYYEYCIVNLIARMDG